MKIEIYIYKLIKKKVQLFNKYCDNGFEISLYWFNIIVYWESEKNISKNPNKLLKKAKKKQKKLR